MTSIESLETSFREWWAAQGYVAKPNPHTVNIATAWASTLLPPEPAGADGPAVPEGREPASVATQPSDRELLELMPETMRDEFAYAATTCSDATGGQVKPRIFRVCLNTAALEYARAVLARWGTPNQAEIRSSPGDAPAPVPVNERLPGDALCWWYEPDEDDDGSGYGGNWTLLRIRGGVSCYTHWLPVHALPLPSGEVER